MCEFLKSPSDNDVQRIAILETNMNIYVGAMKEIHTLLQEFLSRNDTALISKAMSIAGGTDVQV